MSYSKHQNGMRQNGNFLILMKWKVFTQFDWIVFYSFFHLFVFTHFKWYGTLAICTQICWLVIAAPRRCCYYYCYYYSRHQPFNKINQCNQCHLSLLLSPSYRHHQWATLTQIYTHASSFAQRKIKFMHFLLLLLKYLLHILIYQCHGIVDFKMASVSWH